MGNKVPFYGILVTGQTKEEALAAYSQAMTGESAYPVMDGKKSFLFLSNVSPEDSLHSNPLTGESDLEEVPSLLEKVQAYSAKASTTSEKPVYYTICASETGCKSRIVCDSKQILHFCPVCASEIEDLSDEEIAAYEEEMTDEENDLGSDDSEFELEAADGGDDEEAEEEAEDEDDSDTDIDSLLDEDLEAVDSDEESDESEEMTAESASDEEESDDSEEEVEEDDDSSDEDDLDMDVEEGDDEEEGEDSTAEASASDKTPKKPSSLTVDCDRIVVFASTQSRAIEKYRDLLLRNRDVAIIAQASSKTGFLTALSDASTFEHSPIDGSVVDIVDKISSDNELIDTVCASAEDSSLIKAHLMECVSSTCGVFVVTSHDDTTLCPICASILEEPAELDKQVVNSSLASDTPEGLAAEITDDDMTIVDLPEETVINSVNPEVQVPVAASGKLTVNLVNHVTASSENAKLEVAYCGSINKEPSWIAFLDGVPVAKATSISAANHARIFEDVAFANALLASAQENGVNQALTDMGFKPLEIEVVVDKDVDALVKNQVEAATASASVGYEKERNEFEERFLAALATAAVGINRGFFKNLNNPVKQALWNSLSAAGMRQPEALIDNVFSAQADSYHKVLLDKAREIVSKPLEIQNELTNAIMDSNYLAVASTSSELEDRLAGMGTPVKAVASNTDEKDVVSIDQQKIRSVVSSLGQRRR